MKAFVEGSEGKENGGIGEGGSGVRQSHECVKGFIFQCLEV